MVLLRRSVTKIQFVVANIKNSLWTEPLSIPFFLQEQSTKMCELPIFFEIKFSTPPQRCKYFTKSSWLHYTERPMNTDLQCFKTTTKNNLKR